MSTEQNQDAALDETASSPARDAQPVRRTTKQRLAITELLGRGEGFRTAQQLHLALREAGHGTGLATVYRTLQVMADAGEVDAIRTDDGEVAYRQCQTIGHHHHLICRNCGRTVEIEARIVEKWASQVATENGFRDAGHDLELFGLCSDC